MEGQTITINGECYGIIKLIAKGKGGYNYLSKTRDALVVVKQIHYEPCDYFQFEDNKLNSELRDYKTLFDLGIPMFTNGGYAVDDVFAFAESFLRGGTDFEEPLAKAVELIEHNDFQNADILFLTDGECAVSEDFIGWFQSKSKQLNFTVTGLVMDTDSPGMTFSLTPFCEKIYRLSEMACNEVASGVIINIGW